MLLNSQFSSNYFSISQVEQNFDDFDKEFTCERAFGCLGVGGGGRRGRADSWQISVCGWGGGEELAWWHKILQAPPSHLMPHSLLTFYHPHPHPPHRTGPLPGEDKFWRFNRTQDYGYKGTNETAEQLKVGGRTCSSLCLCCWECSRSRRLARGSAWTCPSTQPPAPPAPLPARRPTLAELVMLLSWQCWVSEVQHRQAGWRSWRASSALLPTHATASHALEGMRKGRVANKPLPTRTTYRFETNVCQPAYGALACQRARA